MSVCMYVDMTMQMECKKERQRNKMVQIGAEWEVPGDVC